MNALWQEIAENIGTSPVVAAWFTTAGAVIAAVVSALVSYLVAHRSVYINAVTVERSKWIETLRVTISGFSGAAERVNTRRKQDSEYSKGADWATDTQALQKLLSDLTLRLNPVEPEAMNLLKAARKLDQTARLHRPVDFILANEIMIRHAQWVLKAEWERVKEEASGWVAGPYFAIRRFNRRRAYRRFLAADGRLSRLALIGSGKSVAVMTQARIELDEPVSASDSWLHKAGRLISGRLDALFARRRREEFPL